MDLVNLIIDTLYTRKCLVSLKGLLGVQLLNGKWGYVDTGRQYGR